MLQSQRVIWVVLLLAFGIAGCGRDDGDAGEPAPRTGPAVVQCVNYPLAYFARRLAGPEPDVRCEAPADEDPAFWQPTDDQVAAFQNADLIVRNGAGYAQWMQSHTLPRSRTVDTSASFAERLIVREGETTHTHGPAGEHGHGRLAFTTWLDFELAAAQAAAVGEALVQHGIAPAEAVRQRQGRLAAELMALHERMKALGTAHAGLRLRASHPVYGYFARAYGFRIESEHFEPGELPSDAMFDALRAKQAKHPTRWMLWEGTPLPETAERLEALGIRSVVFDPCGATPDEGDFLTVMKANIARLEKALGA